MDAEEYILSHISAEPPHLEALYRRTHLTHLLSKMCSGHLEGRLLNMLVAMIKPQRVLELGTFTGYSALCLAENLPEGGEVHTIEIDDEMEPELTELFATYPAETNTLHIGDAPIHNRHYSRAIGTLSISMPTSATTRPISTKCSRG